MHPTPISIPTLADYPTAAQHLIQTHPDVKTWFLEGQLGAGKTTLVQAACQVLGVTGPVQSPTYAMVNEYKGAGGQKVYHLDLYRLNRGDQEALEMGLDHYLHDPSAWCFVEWGSQAPGIRPDSWLEVYIAADSDGTRRLAVQVHHHG